jgi:hypothetical protein
VLALCVATFLVWKREADWGSALFIVYALTMFFRLEWRAGLALVSAIAIWVKWCAWIRSLRASFDSRPAANEHL